MQALYWLTQRRGQDGCFTSPHVPTAPSFPVVSGFSVTVAASEVSSLDMIHCTRTYGKSLILPFKYKDNIKKKSPENQPTHSHQVAQLQQVYAPESLERNKPLSESKCRSGADPVKCGISSWRAVSAVLNNIADSACKRAQESQDKGTWKPPCASRHWKMHFSDQCLGGLFSWILGSNEQG